MFLLGNDGTSWKTLFPTYYHLRRSSYAKYNGIIIGWIWIKSVFVGNTIGKSNRFIASRAEPIFMQGSVIKDSYKNLWNILEHVIAF